MVPNFGSPQSQCPGSAQLRGLTGDTSERPFARTHCTLRRSAPRSPPATPQRPSLAAGLLSSWRPPSRAPPPGPQPRPFSPQPRIPVRLPQGHERPCCLLSTPAVTIRSRVCARARGPSLPRAPSSGPRRAGEFQSGGCGRPILVSVKCKVPHPDRRAPPGLAPAAWGPHEPAASDGGGRADAPSLRAKNNSGSRSPPSPLPCRRPARPPLTASFGCCAGVGERLCRAGRRLRSARRRLRWPGVKEAAARLPA